MIIQRVQQGRVSQEMDITEQELEGFLADRGCIQRAISRIIFKANTCLNQN